MNNLNLIVPIASVLIGAIAGLLTTLSVRAWEDRRVERQIRRRVLFLQLEALHSLRTSDFRQLPSQVAELFAKKFGVPVEEMAAEFQKLPGFYQAIQTAVERDFDESVISRYEAALNELAPIDPVDAFRMTGRLELRKYRAGVDKYFAAIASMPDIDAPSSDVAASVTDMVGHELFDAAVSRLEEDITSVAANVDLATRKEVRAAVERMRDPSLDEESQRKFNRIMDEIIRVAAAQPPDVESPPAA